MSTEGRSTSVQPKTPVVARKKRHNKRKISKHIKDHINDSRGKVKLQQNDDETAVSLEKDILKQSGSKKRKKKGKQVKDPAEAHAYLTAWKACQTSDKCDWKFNKNTQSWLIRHMYEADKVSKASFALLVEYLSGMQGDTMKQRVLEDATRRAIRYKQFEKNGVEISGSASPSEKSRDASNTPSDDDQQLDDMLWSRLDDHDKRKEYKRARKVLDVLQPK